MTVPDTGDWSFFQTIRKHGVVLSAGPHTMKLIMDSINPTTGAVGSFNYLALTTSAPYGGTARAIPGRVETEDFDVNPSGAPGEAFAYHDTTAANLGGVYRLDEAVDISLTGDVGGGHNVAWTESGEWLGYTVNIRSTGRYEFRARVAHPGVGGTFHLEIDGQNVTGPITVPDTGGWASWVTLSVITTLPLPAGTHVMYVVLDTESSLTGAFANVNYFEFLAIDTVGVNGGSLTVNEVPGFYVFVSYFDYNDVSEAELRHDFSEFRRLGFHGVRMFPNWWNWRRQGDGAHAYAGDTVIQHDGTIDEAAYGNMLWYLDRAREYGLIVDLSFSAETVAECGEHEDCLAPTSPVDEVGQSRASLDFTEYKAGIIEIAQRLRQRELSVGARIHGNVIFDVQNEGNGHGPLWDELHPDQVEELINAVKAIDPLRIAFGSVAYGFNGVEAGDWAEDSASDVVAYHEPRPPDAPWWTATEQHISDIRTRTQKVIYFQEPEHYRDQPWLTADGFLDAVCRAKRYRATGWTFHSTAGFHMNVTGFFGPQDEWGEKLKPVEQQFLEQMSAKLATPECQPQ